MGVTTFSGFESLMLFYDCFHFTNCVCSIRVFRGQVCSSRYSHQNYKLCWTLSIRWSFSYPLRQVTWHTCDPLRWKRRSVTYRYYPHQLPVGYYKHYRSGGLSLTSHCSTVFVMSCSTQPLVKISPSFKDSLLLVLRKSLFSRCVLPYAKYTVDY